MQDDENVKLTKEEIRNFAQFSSLDDAEIESLIELMWQYSLIAYRAYKMKDDKLNI